MGGIVIYILAKIAYDAGHGSNIKDPVLPNVYGWRNKKSWFALCSALPVSISTDIDTRRQLLLTRAPCSHERLLERKPGPPACGWTPVALFTGRYQEPGGVSQDTIGIKAVSRPWFDATASQLSVRLQRAMIRADATNTTLLISVLEKINPFASHVLNRRWYQWIHEYTRWGDTHHHPLQPPLPPTPQSRSQPGSDHQSSRVSPVRPDVKRHTILQSTDTSHF
ncbi:uncharacterized protein H6S33_006305 [Morchella sextelata]|uniref:uncharacterized protein n=1 Tax=Morchella sextelata TaxID=1174677 RepID=UPI001D04581B|nr:uncharacterized protein H6S33_006305 [Morchella sextelata]KAH0604637.1 hypothetical protein H6S33_006305 [Morchella sextelata]